MSRKVCVVTGSRAEYGLLKWIMRGIWSASDLSLQIIATGMHLSPEFGLTYRQLNDDGFEIDYKVEMLLSSDTPSSIAKSMGLGMIGFSDAFNQLKPDILVVLGDRFEIMSAVSAALVACIPIAHIHGGESSEGAIDEAIRHSITKMSHLHFVAAEPYRQRVIQLGEQPTNVFVVGGLGIDGIKNLELLEKQEIEKILDFKFAKKNLLVTFHPVTLEDGTAPHQMRALLSALETLVDTQLIFTLPNADTGGREIINLIHAFVSTHSNARAFTSLGQLYYLSCLRYVDGVVGNSSSGLLEVPTFRKGTVNIGERQRGRLKASSVIDCTPDERSIAGALERLYSADFHQNLCHVINPYGDGGASNKVVQKLSEISLSGLIQKSFFDLGVVYS